MDDGEPGTGGGLSPMRFVGVGFELIVPILVGLYLGHRLDGWLEIEPWGLVGGAVLGMLTGFVQFFRSVLPPRRRGGGPDQDGA